MRILGIDPGFATIGFGVLEADRGNCRLIQYGTITTPANMEFSERLRMIYDDMSILLERFNPDVVAIEELFWGHNVTTGIGVSHGRGVILLSIAQRRIPIHEYTPMQIKQAVVGYGHATKQQVMDMTRRLLKMDKPARPDDAADAIAVALCHGRAATSSLLGIKQKGSDTMFYYLNGVVAAMEANLAVIDCGGVGFACNTTAYTLSQLQIGKTQKLYTYCNVKEDAFDIYGFCSRDELASFQQLLAVSGVGPKAALSILSSLTPDQFALAIVTGDEKTLTRAPGVGKKMAQRILLELKDKLTGYLQSSNQASGPIPAHGAGKMSEATAALASLGYSQSEIGTALKGVDVENLPVEEIIRRALRAMVKQ